MNKYQCGEATKTMGKLMEAASMGMPADPMMIVIQPHLLVMALLDGERFDGLMKGAEKVAYMGKEKVGEENQERVRISAGELDFDVWVPEEGEAWIEKVSPDMTRAMKAAARMGGPEEKPPKIEVVFSDWKGREEFEDGAFTFKPPEGAEQVKSLEEAARAENGGGEVDHATLLGKPAPELGLELLDGGKVMMADLRGKVVVLDFWATWCGPCVRGLPVVSKAAAAFKDKGVVFYAVNQQE